MEFISELKDTVYRLAFSLVGNSVEAEDIAQDIYERVWRARDTLLTQSYPRAYVCRMTHNLAIDRLRRRQRLQMVEGGEYIITTAPDDGNAQSDLNDMAAITHRAIAQLPDKQRFTIHMRDVEGYEIDEIAAMLECDETSVRMNLSRARRTVREQLLKVMSYGVE